MGNRTLAFVLRMRQRKGNRRGAEEGRKASAEGQGHAQEHGGSTTQRQMEPPEVPGGEIALVGGADGWDLHVAGVLLSVKQIA